MFSPRCATTDYPTQICCPLFNINNINNLKFLIDCLLPSSSFSDPETTKYSTISGHQNSCLTQFQRKFHVNFRNWRAKDPGHSAKKCRWQVTPKHAYTLDPTKSEWDDYAAVQAQCGNLSGNELTRNSSRNTWTQSSQLADSDVKCGISVRELISTSKKCMRGMNCQTFSQNPGTRGKSHQFN